MGSILSQIRVMIVDDHPIVCEGLAALLNKQRDIVTCGEAAGESETLALLKRANPDVIVVDLSLKEGSGLDLIKEIRRRRRRVRILVASAHHESLFAERALHAGASGYLNKGTDRRDIVAAIRCIMSGDVYLSQRLRQHVLRKIGAEAQRPIARSPVEELTDRELEVYSLIGQGRDRRAIAERLDLSTKTVDTYRHNIRRKLHLENNAELTRHAVEWRLKAQEGDSS